MKVTFENMVFAEKCEVDGLAVTTDVGEAVQSAIKAVGNKIRDLQSKEELTAAVIKTDKPKEKKEPKEPKKTTKPEEIEKTLEASVEKTKKHKVTTKAAEEEVETGEDEDDDLEVSEEEEDDDDSDETSLSTTDLNTLKKKERIKDVVAFLMEKGFQDDAILEFCRNNQPNIPALVRTGATMERRVKDLCETARA